jgi:hypothetical protein
MSTAKISYDTLSVVDAVPQASRTGTGAAKGRLARWFAAVLEKGQSLRFLEDVGGL